MVKELNYSKREQDTFRSTMVTEMSNQSATLNKILEQTTRHNGRMTKIEDKIEDYPQLKSQVNTVSTWKIEFMSEIRGMRRVMVAVVIILPTLISTIFILYINNLRQSIIKDASDAVVGTLEERYNLKVTNN